MTGMPHSVRRLLPVPVLLLALAGCGSEKQAAEAPKPTPKVTPDPAAGSFPDRPQVVEKFSDPGSGWPRDGYRGGAFVFV